MRTTNHPKNDGVYVILIPLFILAFSSHWLLAGSLPTNPVLVSDRTTTWNGIAQPLTGKIRDSQTCRITGWTKIQNAAPADVRITIKQTDDTRTKYLAMIPRITIWTFFH